ncbi:hypothetical protein DFQ28_006865 [Apophysomyces sp. BC1034]|nr:hypothetical protein DFQ30_000002 [Apophysomyces sp. BC1015]KAG0182003.1 hypothetical protein DFQ29_006262 [Apophysomyces sp. BC1021]KAG0192981.1 hypothetical protein DFQ28_006865 [Apophysomyces sp. BC1034]
MDIASTKVLVAITSYLSLRDLVCLSSTCRELHRRVFMNPTIWTSRMLFDRGITDAAVAGLVPKIPRSYYAIRDLRLNNLEISTHSIFLILNQFGHCVKTLEFTTNAEQLTQLCTHLEAFAFHLAQRQASNRIPLSFAEYSYNHVDLVAQAQQAVIPRGPDHHHYHDYPYYTDEINYAKVLASVSLPQILDDPPFEELEKLCIRSTSTSCGLLDRLHHLFGYLSQNKLHLSRHEESEILCVAKTDTFWNNERALERRTESLQPGPPPMFPIRLTRSNETPQTRPAQKTKNALHRFPQPIVRVMRYRPSPKRRPFTDNTTSPGRRVKIKYPI